MLGSQRFRRTSTGLAVLVLLAFGGSGSAAASSTYRIAPGDTLYGIAARYGLSAQEIASLNGLTDPNVIFAGQDLALPGGVAAQAVTGGSENASSSYTVQPGDTLWSIAALHGMTVAQLVEANRGSIVNENLIYTGQVLSIPGAGGASAVPSPAQTTDVGTLLEQTATAYGLDPALVKAIAWQESGWRQQVVSYAGAQGVMQVMPATGGWVATELVGRPLDISGSASDNILAGVVYLEWLIRYTGSEQSAIAAYYQGPGSVSRDGIFADTASYVQNVDAIRAYIRQHGSPPS